MILFIGVLGEAETVTISGKELNVRSGPDRTYDVIDVVKQHEKFEVLEKRDGWYKISVEGQLGWISAKGIALSEDANIEELIALADRYFRQRQFTTPADANAFDLYQSVLQTDPTHAHARRQIEDMAHIYHAWAEAATQRGDQETARIYYERYRFVMPESQDSPHFQGILKHSKTSSRSAPASDSALRILHLRSTPAALSEKALQEMIQALRFHHPADWSKYRLSASITGTIQHDYEKHITSDRTPVVVDYATNLMWQHTSPASPISWNEARNEVHRLNSAEYAGYSDWRLPTIEELASLLEPEKSSKHLYIDPIFGSTQLWCWSADTVASSPEMAWYISFSSGGIQPHDIKHSAFILVVRSLQ